MTPARAAGAALLWIALAASAVAAEEPLQTRAETGPVSATVTLTPSEPRIGDSLVLVLEVRAEPLVELLMPEFGEALDRFAISDFSKSETADADGATISRQRYTLAPSRSGAQSIPPLLVEFVDRRPGQPLAPDGEDAFELFTETLHFDVDSALAADAPLEFRPMLGTLGPLETGSRAAWAWLAAAIAVLVVAAPFVWRSVRSMRARARRSSAYQVARRQLDALFLRPRPGADEMDAYFVELSATIRRYLEDRFGLRSPELTTEEFLEALADSPDLVRSHQELLRAFLSRADLVKFAHYVPTPADVEDSLDAARRFLESTREDAPAVPPGARAVDAAPEASGV